MSAISKTIAYFRRNGIMNTFYAVVERLSLQRSASYSYADISDDEYELQKECCRTSALLFSILVPIYETKEEHLRAMIDSCLNQSYGKFELILADASASTGPENVIKSYDDDRIKYIKVENNGGISANTNVAIENASGDYCVLCDHDDLLARNALFEIFVKICEMLEDGHSPLMIYTDEDKCDSKAEIFFEPNIKADFNLDMLLSNNYICHITSVRSDVIKSLKLRPEFDGAQDHDLVLRIVGKALATGNDLDECIGHVQKVLYHWRCHEASTASNPESKNYAYEAGKRAVEDFVKTNFGPVRVEHLKHRGFYHADYGKDIFNLRKDLGAIGGYVTERNKIIGGAYDKLGLPDTHIKNIHYSGINHVGAVTRDVYALDLRNMTPCSELKPLYCELLNKWQEEIISLAKESDKGSYVIDYETREELIIKYSLLFAKEAANKGYKLLLDPQYKHFSVQVGELSDAETIPVSIVIPNMNGKNYVLACLNSIKKSKAKPYEIIVVDNASRDDSVKAIKEKYPDVKVIEHEINTGFTGAVNNGIRIAEGKYIFLLNNDTTIEENCLGNLYEAVEKDDKIFSAGALMLKMDDPDIVDDAGDKINFIGYPKSFAAGKAADKFISDKVAPVFSSCAGAAMYRKSILDEIGLFDEMHFAYFEDVDMGFRARILGYSNVNVRNALVYHKGSATSGSKHNKFKVSLSSKNSVLLFTKNLPLLHYLIFFIFLLIGYLIKFTFFTLKGLGIDYAKGIITGFKEAISHEGRQKHVRFRLKNLKHYFFIQMWFFN